VGVQNDAIARLDGDTGERDRLCRFHRHRDLLVIRQKIERQALVGTQISTGDPSRIRNPARGSTPELSQFGNLVIGSGAPSTRTALPTAGGGGVAADVIQTARVLARFHEGSSAPASTGRRSDIEDYLPAGS
jgi:hypothetical protein